MIINIKNGKDSADHAKDRGDFLKEYKSSLDTTLRASGRTTRRLLTSAINVSERPGVPIVVIAFNNAHARHLTHRLIDLCQNLNIPLPKVVHAISEDEYLNRETILKYTHWVQFHDHPVRR